MKTVAILVTLLSCYLMFLVKRETKAAMLVMGAMTLTLVNVPVVPLHKANFLLQMSFLLSEWKHLRWHFMELRCISYLRKLLILVTFFTLFAALTSSYVKVGSFLQSELLFKYFAIAYAFWAVKDEKSLKPMVRLSLYCLVVLTIFGVLNYMKKNAVFVNAMTEGKTSLIWEGVNFGDVYADRSRFRVQSMFKFAFDYGYICVAILLMHLYAWHRGLERKTPFLIALGCCLFGVVTCECRIVWVCCVLSVCTFYLWCFSLNKTIIAGILALTTFIFSYSTIEVVEEKVDSVTDIFKENPETGGSSMEMRLGQLSMTLFYIDGHELLGLGKGYFANTRTGEGDTVEGLMGLESVVFQYLLERGFVGFVSWVVFYAWIFKVFWRNRKGQALLTGVGASVWVVYILFALGTGELGSVYPTMLLFGVVVKVIEYNKLKCTQIIKEIKNESTRYRHPCL